jgi:flagellar protein FlaG
MPPSDISPVSQVASAPTAPALGRATAPQAAQPAAPAALPPAPVVQAPEKLQIDLEAMQKQLQDVVEMLNTQLAQNASNLGFSVDRVANRHVVTVVDQQSGEVIREIPGEAVLRVAHNIESLKGILYSKTV